MSDAPPLPDLPLADLAFQFRPDLSEASLAPVAVDGVQLFDLSDAAPTVLMDGKHIQRAEFSETDQSDDANSADGMIWYSWKMFVDPATDNPDGGSKLHIAQFHQRDGLDGTATAPALMFNIDGAGALVAQFEAAVGKRAHVLVEGGADGQAAKGYWIEVLVGADWQTTNGLTEIYLRPEGESQFHLAAMDVGANTSTGQVFFKYGAYRSFLERDPASDAADTRIAFTDVQRLDSPDAVLGAASTLLALSSLDAFDFGGTAFAAPLSDDGALFGLGTGPAAPTQGIGDISLMQPDLDLPDLGLAWDPLG